MFAVSTEFMREDMVIERQVWLPRGANKPIGSPHSLKSSIQISESVRLQTSSRLLDGCYQSQRLFLQPETSNGCITLIRYPAASVGSHNAACPIPPGMWCPHAQRQSLQLRWVVKLMLLNFDCHSASAAKTRSSFLSCWRELALSLGEQ